MHGHLEARFGEVPRDLAEQIGAIKDQDHLNGPGAFSGHVPRSKELPQNAPAKLICRQQGACHAEDDESMWRRSASFERTSCSSEGFNEPIFRSSRAIGTDCSCCR
jgi:hypothetical protein